MDGPQDDTEYRVWADMTGKPCAESSARWSVIAQFRYLLDAIDYTGYLNSIRADAVLTGPCGMATAYPAN